MLRDIPLGEMARPEDVANVIAFLASGLARHARERPRHQWRLYFH